MTTNATADPTSLDLNLLVTLEALLEEAHVTRAATRLSTSQPAVSRSLARLREHFGDPLLVRVGASLQPTAAARALLPRLRLVLQGVREVARPTTFDPQTATGIVRLAAPDIVSWIVVPPLLGALAKEAPGLDLEIVQWQPDWRAHLEGGDVDLTIGFPKGDEAQIYTRPLFAQDWAVVLRRTHPALRRRLTPAVYASLDHVVVGIPHRGASAVDEALAADARARRVRLRVPYPLLAPMLAVDSDVVVTTVRWLALRLADRHDVVVRRPPVPLPRVRVPMVWHERAHLDPRQRWLRDRIAALTAALDTRQLLWPTRA